MQWKHHGCPARHCTGQCRNETVELILLALRVLVLAAGSCPPNVRVQKLSTAILIGCPLYSNLPLLPPWLIPCEIQAFNKSLHSSCNITLEHTVVNIDSCSLIHVILMVLLTFRLHSPRAAPSCSTFSKVAQVQHNIQAMHKRVSWSTYAIS